MALLMAPLTVQLLTEELHLVTQLCSCVRILTPLVFQLLSSSTRFVVQSRCFVLRYLRSTLIFGD